MGVPGGDNVDAVDTVAWDACLFICLPDIVLLQIHIQTLFTCLLDIVLYHIHIQTQDLLLLLLVFGACYVSGH